MRRKPVVVDLFCGAGGESQGIHWALGDDIRLFAVNHWERACETHARNFTKDECVCQDIQTVIPTDLVKDRQVELMWASPECTNFSVARGGKPMASRENRKRDFKDYPGYERQYIRTFERMLAVNRGGGVRKEYESSTPFLDGQDVFDWWMHRPAFKERHQEEFAKMNNELFALEDTDA